MAFTSLLPVKEVILILLPLLSNSFFASAFSPALIGYQQEFNQYQRKPTRIFNEWRDESLDPNLWTGVNDIYEEQEDWQTVMNQKQDGTFWESSIEEDTTEISLEESEETSASNVDDSEAWLDTLASLAAEEVEFNLKEADRADKVRQMQEWGFENDVIASTLDVAVDTSLEKVDEVEGMQLYLEESYVEEIDMATVESHTMVEKDPDTGEPIRTQMVYVDEHSCIGCTNCAMIAQSTFYMNEEHGRARVFQQWGDDDETIQIAIETCPVDCIHYVPFEELVELEVDRREQNINFKARLVNQGDLSHRAGGPVAYTAPQEISGNMLPRCNNCPSQGCKNCPLFGVGKNPEFEKKEKARKERMAKRKIMKAREDQSKSADL